MKKSYISSKNLKIMLSILIVLIAIGSFCDLQISQGIFGINNPIAIFFASFGTFPGSLLFGIMGMLILKGCANKSKFLIPLGVIALVLFEVFGIYITYTMSSEYWFNLSDTIKFLISTVLILGIQIPFISIIKEADNKKCAKYFFFLLIVAIFGLFYPSLIKSSWARPRYRFLAGVDASGLEIAVKSDLSNFRNWFNIDPSVKNQFLALGIDDGEFESFPSGHVAQTAIFLAISTIGYINPKYESKANVILWVGFGYCLFLGLTRMMMGAHFLTDVTIALLLDVLFIYLLTIIFKIKKDN